MTMDYRVRIVSDNKEMKDFLELPLEIYKDDPVWVSPLISETSRVLDTVANPYFRNVNLQKFICYKGDEPVARTIIVINREHWNKFGKKSAFFGYFESVNDQEAVGQLFEVAAKYCQLKGAEYLEGPFNPNHYSELGLLVSNFDSPQIFFETYNPEYYMKLLESTGFNVACRLHTRINRDTANYLRRNHPVSSNRNNGDFRVRHFSLFNMKAELERIREINNDAFSYNWHFLPLSQEEYLFSAKFMFLVTYPKLIIIVEHGKEPVGVLQCVLNINNILRPMRGKVRLPDYLRFLNGRRSVSDIVIYAIGIKKAYQKTRVFKLMFDGAYKIFQRYPVVSTTWMTENNVAATRASELLGLKPYKWFAIYEKFL